jgi:phosphatidylglycerophosphate synthase
VSVVALLTGCLAGVAYGLTRLDPGLFLVGGALVAVSGIADGLDGVMARLQRRTSALGDFLDHVFDRLVEIAVLGGLALSPHATTVLGLGVLAGVLLTSYLGTQIQASFGARHYTGLGKAELFVGLVLASAVLGVTPNALIPLLGREVSLVDALFAVVGLSTVHAVVHRLRLAVRLASGERPR